MKLKIRVVFLERVTAFLEVLRIDGGPRPRTMWFSLLQVPEGDYWEFALKAESSTRSSGRLLRKLSLPKIEVEIEYVLPPPTTPKRRMKEVFQRETVRYARRAHTRNGKGYIHCRHAKPFSLQEKTANSSLLC